MPLPLPLVSDRFLADHQRLEGLLGKLCTALEANDAEATSGLWAEFRSGLLAHMEAEEAHLVSHLLRRSDRDARILVQEHRHIRTRLADLTQGMESGVVRLDDVRNFIDELHAHCQSEDRLLYRWTDAHLDESHRMTAIDALSSDVPAVATRSV